MSVYHEYYLTAPGLQRRLLQDSFVHEQILHRPDGTGVRHDYCLDYRKTNPSEAKSYRNFVAYERREQNAPAKYLTDESLDEALYFPVFFKDDGDTIGWMSRYEPAKEPAFFVSMAYPDMPLLLTHTCEGELISSGYIRTAAKPIFTILNF